MSSRKTEKQRNLVFLVWCSNKHEKKGGISTAELGRMAGYKGSGGLYPALKNSNLFKEQYGIWSLSKEGESFFHENVKPLLELNRRYISFLIIFFSSFLFLQWIFITYFKIIFFTSGAIWGILIGIFFYKEYYKIIWFLYKHIKRW